MKQAVRHAWMPHGVKPSPDGKWVEYAAYKQLEKLLEEFAEVYSESTIAPAYHERAHKMWRSFLEQSGKHMIRTDEGWEDGQAKASYVEIAESEGLPLSELILDEVNAPPKPCQHVPGNAGFCKKCGAERIGFTDQWIGGETVAEREFLYEGV